MKKKYVIVEVSGGVAYPFAEEGVEVHIIDWDNISSSGGPPTLPDIPNLRKLIESSEHKCDIFWEPLPGPAEQFTADEQRTLLELARVALAKPNPGLQLIAVDLFPLQQKVHRALAELKAEDSNE